jgi:predicted nucleotidyltransferase
MPRLEETSLANEERALVERYAEELGARLGEGLHAVWLFGSRARGEERSEDSDVDMLVIVDDASWDRRMSIRGILEEVARELHLEALPFSFSVHVHDPAWLEGRREIGSFFVAELDRDKVVLSGSA